MIFFTSDTHFGHKNIIQYCSRPFKDRDHMNESIIQNWNRVVGAEDTVYHLGDVSFVNNDWTSSILRRLNGTICHIKGNHDKKLKTDRFEWSKEDFELELNGQWMYLRHHYLEDWPLKEEDSWHLHGHSHGNLQSKGMLRLDVGVDPWGFTPITFSTIRAYFDGEIEPNWAKPSPENEDYRKSRSID